tara:strand:+ start:4873 stop:5706 length:834 start_codon:yes stop_codon:yes gene_type:complete
MKSSKSIGWINGHWGKLEQLTVAIEDRGLKYADGIFETILIAQGKAKLLSSHLSRWKKNAKQLGMALPPTEDWLNPLIQESIYRCSLHKGYGALRLNWSRGNSHNRAIFIKKENTSFKSHQFWLELHAITPCFKPITTIISCLEKRNANSILSTCKTFAYGQAIQAQLEAEKLGADQALLESTNGELCCGTTSNIIIKRNKIMLTPRLKSGCLPGVMRQQGLNSGIIKEVQLTSVPQRNDEWLLINSLGCKPIYKVNQTNLNPFPNPEEFWLSLYAI